VESGKWRVVSGGECGECRVEYWRVESTRVVSGVWCREWRVENGELWRVESGEWRVVNGEW
jgi:hypothetical protein